MLITPKLGRRIFGFLMVFAGLGIIVGLLTESLRARSRTSVAEAHVLNSYGTMMGIGPLRHYSTNTKYEFLVNGVRFEKQHAVDNLPAGVVFVQFDPRRPQNNRLALPDSAPQFLGILGGFFFLIGAGLALHTWKPIAFFRSALPQVHKK